MVTMVDPSHLPVSSGPTGVAPRYDLGKKTAAGGMMCGRLLYLRSAML